MKINYKLKTRGYITKTHTKKIEKSKTISCGRGEIGKRVGLRILCPKGLVGSSPTVRTTLSLLQNKKAWGFRI